MSDVYGGLRDPQAEELKYRSFPPLNYFQPKKYTDRMLSTDQGWGQTVQDH